MSEVVSDFGGFRGVFDGVGGVLVFMEYVISCQPERSSEYVECFEGGVCSVASSGCVGMVVFDGFGGCELEPCERHIALEELVPADRLLLEKGCGNVRMKMRWMDVERYVHLDTRVVEILFNAGCEAYSVRMAVRADEGFEK